MRNCERHYGDVRNLERSTSREYFQLGNFGLLAGSISNRARPRLMSCPGHKKRDLQFLGYSCKPIDVVRMFLGDEDG